MELQGSIDKSPSIPCLVSQRIRLLTLVLTYRDPFRPAFRHDSCRPMGVSLLFCTISKLGHSIGFLEEIFSVAFLTVRLLFIIPNFSP